MDEDPFTNKRTIIKIKIGERLQRKCPMYYGDFSGKEQNVDILITMEMNCNVNNLLTV